MKILIADDDRTTRTLLGRWVGRWKYEAIAVEDGTEALKVLAEQPDVHLCLLDWMMPGKTGVEICKEIRAQESDSYVYSILLTSKTDTESVVRGLEAGADDYIVKPCHPLELEVRLRAGRRVVELQERLVEAQQELARHPVSV